MKLKIKLSKELEKEYYAIGKEFDKIQSDWKKYNDEIIPEDMKFAVRIIRFLIDVVDFAIDNYEKLNIPDYAQFLGYYYYEFFYGPNGDDNTYLDFDEKLNGEPVSEFCWELMDDDYNVSKEKLKKIKLKYEKVLKKF